VTSPVSTDDGSIIWACCWSTIGPLCGHSAASARAQADILADAEAEHASAILAFLRAPVDTEDELDARIALDRSSEYLRTLV
jgi:hypothetical protein